MLQALAPIPQDRRLLARLLVLLLAAAIIGLVFALGWHRALTLGSLRDNFEWLAAVRDRHPVLFPSVYVLLYVTMAALAIPGALIMTLSGGALFGLAEGVLLASFAASVGATLALLVSRFVLRDMVRRRYRTRLDQVDRGLEHHGWLYLLSLRLVPAIPFFVVDLLFGVTNFPVGRFYAVSQLGMLPATIVYVNAGTQLEHLHSLSDILSPGLIVSLALLGCLPLVARLVIRS